MPVTQADALNLALAGVDVTHARINTLAQNISNAQNPGYTVKQQGQITGALGIAVLAPVQRNVDAFLQQSLNTAQGSANQLSASVDLLSNIETSFGTPDSDTSLSSSITGLQNTWQNLSVNPEQSSLYTSVINAAGAVARNLNGLSQTIATTKASAQTQIAQDVTVVNQTLQALDAINHEIVAHNGTEDVTNEEDQRDQLINQLAGLMDIKTYIKGDGSAVVYTADGKPLIDASTVATISAGGPTGITWSMPTQASSPVRVGSGTLAGLVNLQNTTLPGIQAQLDDIARGLTVEFNSVNIPLFSDGGSPLNGTSLVPTAPATETNPADPLQVNGYAARISVNPAVVSTPAILHDGAVPPALTTAATPLQTGDTSVINTALNLFNRNDIAFTSSTGLPATGGFVKVTTDFVAAQSGLRANAQAQLDSQNALIQTIQNKISAQSGVNVDDQVAQLQVLQNAYSANARVMATCKELYDTLFQAIQ
jgi:flagellar hook-associated protein 1 FlgK